MKNYIILIAIFFTQNVIAQNANTTKQEVNIDVTITYENEQDNIKAIQAILQNQTIAWNKGDLVTFMAGYWNNDSLVFIGKSGPTYGYKNTLANYKKSYPDTSYMGKLNFDIVSIKPLSKNHFFVIGKRYLKRTVGDVNGIYTLVFKKTKAGWKIISDHSS